MTMIESIKNKKLRTMDKKEIKRSIKRQGSALAYVLVILTVVMIILTSMLGYVSSQLKFSFNRVEKEKAFQIAEAGAYYYRWYLAHETSGKTAQQVNDFWESGNALGDISPYEADYEGLGKYSIEVDVPTPGSTIAVVRSTGWSYKDPDLKRTVQVRFRRPSWSEYIFLSNSFMNFGSEAVTYGKVHSNGGIRFDGVAYNTVSSLLPSFDDDTYGGNRMEFGVHTTVNQADPAAPAYPWPDGTVPEHSDVFKGGREFPVPEVNFAGVISDLAYMKSQAESGNGKYFDGTGVGRKITIKTNGTYDVCKVNTEGNNNTHAISSFRGVVSGASGIYSGTNGDSCNTPHCCTSAICPYIQPSKPNRGKCVTMENYPIVDGGVVFVENNIWVEGTVNNNRLTIVAANLSTGGEQKDIYIGISNNDLLYTAYNCNNMLGLIAQQDIRVLGSCPEDFTVDAALMAQGGLVGINDNGFSGKDRLTFNGAIVSYLQPYFHHGNSGFAVRFYNFDNNLLYCPPPYFPTGNEYSIDLWEEL